MNTLSLSRRALFRRGAAGAAGIALAAAANPAGGFARFTSLCGVGTICGLAPITASAINTTVTASAVTPALVMAGAAFAQHVSEDDADMVGVFE